jgi:hypothetical protein
VQGISRKNKKLIEEADKILEGYQIKIDRLIVKAGHRFCGYRQSVPLAQHKNSGISEARQSHIFEGFNKASDFLEQQGLDVMACFAVLDEGGTVIFVTPKAISLRFDVVEKLYEMNNAK